MNVILPLLVLLGCQLVGETLRLLLALPVPGPVLGMLILLAGLALRRGAPARLAAVSNGILAHLSLLFVPAGVGVMLHFARIQAEWPAILLALLGSTWLTLMVTAWTMRLTSRLIGAEEPPAGGMR